MMRPQIHRLHVRARNPLHLKKTWGQMGADHLYLLTYEGGGLLIQTYAREVGAVHVTSQSSICPHVYPCSVGAYRRHHSTTGRKAHLRTCVRTQDNALCYKFSRINILHEVSPLILNQWKGQK